MTGCPSRQERRGDSHNRRRRSLYFPEGKKPSGLAFLINEYASTEEECCVHELGVVFNVIEAVEEIAKENELKKIESVTLELGEVSTVIPEYLTDCWDWAVKRNVLFGDTKLLLEKIPAVTFCEDCKKTYPTVLHGKICPHCGSGRTYLVQGNEFIIKEISAE